MKYFLLTLVITLATFAGTTGGKPPAKNSSVVFSATIKEKTINIGGTGEILISLKPQKGIHINLQPPLNITFDDDSTATLSGTMVVPSVKKDTVEYFDSSKPIKQSFTLAKQLRPGKVSLKGAFVYFFCSDAEGWCSRFKQPFTVEVTVVP